MFILMDAVFSYQNDLLSHAVQTDQTKPFLLCSLVDTMAFSLKNPIV